ncbi:MAG: ABC transporter substrate binding protein [Desulfotignum sp.]|nr:ABC transporter substrate binding protein [Desulfotignum sp.]
MAALPVVRASDTNAAVSTSAAAGTTAPANVHAAAGTTAAIVVSRKIRPYLQVTEGILDQVSRKTADSQISNPKTADSQDFGPRVSDTDVFFLSPGDDLVTAQVTDRLITGAYDLVAAVGPEAAALIWQSGIPGKKIYAAVLDPDAVSQIPDDACGISLRIPVAVQVNTIAAAFPSLGKIGLLFDPHHNQWFFEAASAAAAFSSIPVKIIPLQVTERNQIAPVLAAHLERVDAIWMIPDQTVISEKLIQYVIKQALYKNTGVIGYNAYFIRTGALFSFEFNYQALGRQAGEIITDSLTGKNCGHVPPVFESRSNPEIARKLGVAMEAGR